MTPATIKSSNPLGGKAAGRGPTGPDTTRAEKCPSGAKTNSPVGFVPKGKYGLPLSGVSVQETTFHDPTSGLISTQKPRLAERIRAAISFTLDAPFAMNQSITN